VGLTAAVRCDIGIEGGGPRAGDWFLAYVIGVAGVAGAGALPPRFQPLLTAQGPKGARAAAATRAWFAFPRRATFSAVSFFAICLFRFCFSSLRCRLST